MDTKWNVSWKRRTYLPSDLSSDLKELNCSNNKISSLQPLSNVTALTKLEVHHNPLTSLEGIERLRLVTSFNLSSCGVSSLQLISLLESLKELNINYNSVPSLAPLSSLRSLELLWCSNNEVSDLQPLSTLNKLTFLDCGANWISSLEPLSLLTRLRVLYFHDNHVSSLQPILSLARLEEVDLGLNPLTLLAPIASITTLTTIRFSADQRHRISAIRKHRPMLEFDKWEYKPRSREKRQGGGVVESTVPVAITTLDYSPLLSLLSSLGLSEYNDLFIRERIDMEVARQLNDGEMEKIGLPLGARKKLLQAFIPSSSSSSPPSPAVPAADATVPLDDTAKETLTAAANPSSSVCPTCGHQLTSRPST